MTQKIINVGAGIRSDNRIGEPLYTAFSKVNDNFLEVYSGLVDFQTARRDTALNWTLTNPILLAGEIAIETDTNLIKIGNGIDEWDELAYDIIIANGSQNLTNKTNILPVFRGTRAQLVSKVAGGWTPTVGDLAEADGLVWRYTGAGTAVPGLPGWVPDGQLTFRHFGAVGDGTADDLAAFTATATYAATVATAAGTLEGIPLTVDGEGRVYALSGKAVLRGTGVNYEAFVVLPTAGFADTEPLVIAASGQSNMRGNPGSTGGTFKSNSRVYAWLATTSGGAGAWIQNPNFETTIYYVAGSNVSLGDGVNNLALAFAHRMQEASNRDIRLIIECRGAMNIEQWIDTGTASPQYLALDNRINEALATISASTVDIFLWQQGESNSGNTPTEYAGKLSTLLDQLQAEPWWRGPLDTTFETDTIFLAGEPFYGNASYDSVKEGIWEFYRTEPKGRIFFAQANDLTDNGDTVHFSGPALFELGYYRYFTELMGSPFLWAKPLLETGSPRVTIRDVKVEAQRKCAGVSLFSGTVNMEDCFVTGALSHSVALPSVGSGDRRITRCTFTGLTNGDALFTNQDNWTCRNILSSNADTKIDECVSRWSGVNLMHTAGGATTLVSDTHLYNGGSGVFIPVDTINLWIRAGGLNFDSGYLDNGRTIIEATNASIENCINLAAPTKVDLTSFFLVRSRGTEPRNINIRNMLGVSPSLTPNTGPGPKIQAIKFEPYAGWSWFEGDYTLYNADLPDVWDMGAGRTLLCTSEGTPAIRYVTANPQAIGTRIQFKDADTTTEPVVRSSGNGLTLSAADAAAIITLRPSGVNYAFSSTQFIPPSAGTSALGGASNRWETAHITQINFGPNIRPIRGGTDITPNGILSGSPGSIYVNQDAPTWAQAAWCKITGTSNTGWGLLQVAVEPGLFSGLPSAATAGAGAKGFITDANSTTFAAVVAGGGANAVPVYSDGTNWRVG